MENRRIFIVCLNMLNILPFQYNKLLLSVISIISSALKIREIKTYGPLCVLRVFNVRSSDRLVIEPTTPAGAGHMGQYTGSRYSASLKRVAKAARIRKVFLEGVQL